MLEGREDSSAADCVLVFGEDEQFGEDGFGKELGVWGRGRVRGVERVLGSWRDEGLSDGRKLETSRKRVYGSVLSPG